MGVMTRFPFASEVAYSYQRNWTPTHMGTDIFAPEGSAVLAVENGQAWTAEDPKGGNVVYLEGEKSGARYYYAHLKDFSPFVAPEKRSVTAGALLGTVGTSGNAAGRPPHLHMQLRFGSLAADPFVQLIQVDPKRKTDNGLVLLLLAVLAAKALG